MIACPTACFRGSSPVSRAPGSGPRHYEYAQRLIERLVQIILLVKATAIGPSATDRYRAAAMLSMFARSRRSRVLSFFLQRFPGGLYFFLARGFEAGEHNAHPGLDFLVREQGVADQSVCRPAGRYVLDRP